MLTGSFGTMPAKAAAIDRLGMTTVKVRQKSQAICL